MITIARKICLFAFYTVIDKKTYHVRKNKLVNIIHICSVLSYKSDEND